MNRIKNTAQTIAFLSLGLVIMYVVYNKENNKYRSLCLEEGVLSDDECYLHIKIWEDFQSVNIGWLLVVILAYIISNISRASRWKMLIEAMGYKVKWWNAFWTTMLGYFTNLGLPRSGEFIRAATFARYEKLPFDKTMGTVVVDRIVDLLSFGIVFCLGLLFSFNLLVNFLSENAQFPLHKFMILLGLGLSAGIFLIWLFRNNRYDNIGLVRSIKNMIRGLYDGIRTVIQLENTPLFVLHSIIIWLMYYAMTYFMFFAFAPTAHLGLIAGLVVFIFGSLGMIVPSPGGVGTYQYMVMTALTLYGLSSADGLSFSFILFFALNIFVNIAFGLFSLLILPISNDSYEPERDPRTT